MNEADREIHNAITREQFEAIVGPVSDAQWDWIVHHNDGEWRQARPPHLDPNWREPLP